MPGLPGLSPLQPSTEVNETRLAVCPPSGRGAEAASPGTAWHADLEEGLGVSPPPRGAAAARARGSWFPGADSWQGQERRRCVRLCSRRCHHLPWHPGLTASHARGGGERTPGPRGSSAAQRDRPSLVFCCLVSGQWRAWGMLGPPALSPVYTQVRGARGACAPTCPPGSPQPAGPRHWGVPSPVCPAVPGPGRTADGQACAHSLPGTPAHLPVGGSFTRGNITGLVTGAGDVKESRARL